MLHHQTEPIKDSAGGLVLPLQALLRLASIHMKTGSHNHHDHNCGQPTRLSFFLSRGVFHPSEPVAGRHLAG